MPISLQIALTLFASNMLQNDKTKSCWKRKTVKRHVARPYDVRGATRPGHRTMGGPWKILLKMNLRTPHVQLYRLRVVPFQ